MGAYDTWILTDGKLYFTGRLRDGKHVCDGSRDAAFEMDARELDEEFPNGLPQGWTKELVD